MSRGCRSSWPGRLGGVGRGHDFLLVSKRNTGARGPAFPHGPRACPGWRWRSRWAQRTGPAAAGRRVTMRPPLATASAMCSCTLSSAAGSISGPFGYARLKAVAHLQALHALGQLGDEGIVTSPLARTGGWRRRRSGRRCGTCCSSAPSTALSRSASSKTMKGALPPSSSASFLMVGAHCAIRMRPTSVEPVKLRWRTTGLSPQHLAHGGGMLGGHDVDHALRDTGAVGQLGQGQGAQRVSIRQASPPRCSPPRWPGPLCA